MEAKDFKRQSYIDLWTPIVRECKNSGLSVRKWCEVNEVDEKQYYYWQRRVREDICTTIANEAISVNTSPTFIEVSGEETLSLPQNHSFCPDMIINYGTIRLEIANSTSSQLLNEVMKVINHV